MPKIARGCGTGASSVTSSSAQSGPPAGLRSPLASRSRTDVPSPNATTRSSRTSPACGSRAPGERKVVSRIAGALEPATWPAEAGPLPGSGRLPGRRGGLRRLHMRHGQAEPARLADEVEVQPARGATRQRRDDDLVVAVAIDGVL